MELRVLEIGSAGSRLEWTSGETVVDMGSLNIGPENEELLAEIAELSQFSIEYSTDSFGSFLQVENFEELRAQAETMVDKFDELADATGDSQLVAATEAMRSLVLSDAYIETILVEELVAFHAVYGLTLEPGETFNFADELPNVFGGRPFPATGKIDLVTTADADGCVVIEMVIAPDPEPFVEIMFESLTDYFGSNPLDDPGAREEALEDFQIRNTLRYTYDPASGWMVMVELEKSLVAQGQSRVDRVVIEAT